jgi:hypothetical protein
MTRFFIYLAFFLASGKQVAYVDLTARPRTPETLRTITMGGAGGDGDYHHPNSQALPVSVKLGRLVSLTENGVPRDSVEVVLTNTSDREIILPIGDDPPLVLAPYETDRRYLCFVVKAANIDFHADDANGGIVESARAASSAAHSDTMAHLAPGDSVTYRVPVSRWRANHDRTLVQGAQLELGLDVWLTRVENQPDGSEFHGMVGDPLHSENKVAWPPD